MKPFKMFFKNLQIKLHVPLLILWQLCLHGILKYEINVISLQTCLPKGLDRSRYEMNLRQLTTLEN